MAILLAAWGISFLWRYTPSEVRLANAEIRLANPEIRLINPDVNVTVKEPKASVTPGDHPPIPSGATVGGGQTRSAAGDVLKSEVVVFWEAEHDAGSVITGWKYPDGRAGKPFREYCYYLVPNIDGSSKKVDIAIDRNPIFVGAGLVPDHARAIAKCQWSRNS